MNIPVILGDIAKPDPVTPEAIYGEWDRDQITWLFRALDALSEHQFTILSNHDTLLHDLQKLKGKVDVVFNLCDAGFNNTFSQELHIPALCEMMGFPYTGANPRCLAFCFDKAIMSSIAQHLDIPVPEAMLLPPDKDRLDWPFTFPVIVKPNQGHGSIGITFENFAVDAEALAKSIGFLHKTIGREQYLLVQEFLPGIEIDVGIVGNTETEMTVLPILAKDFSTIGESFPPIASYELKWLSGFPEYSSRPVDFPAETEKRIRDWSRELFSRLGCRDYARMEWRMDRRGNPKLIDVNPNPDWSAQGILVEMAGYAGISYPELLRTILLTAEKRLQLGSQNRSGKS